MKVQGSTETIFRRNIFDHLYAVAVWRELCISTYFPDTVPSCGGKNSELIHSYFKLPQNEPDVDLRFTNNICVKLSPTFRAPGLASCFRYQ